MRVYIDSDYKCRVTPIAGARSIDDTFFYNKCPDLIESYRYVPAGATWTREDGVAFAGLMISPWRDIRQYDGEQQQYLLDKLAAAQAALAESPTADEIAAAIEEGVNSI